MSAPLVSIVMPTYKPEYFEQALRSAVGQSYPNVEIVITDNCPTDAIEIICKKFPAVQYQRNPVRGPENVIRSMYLGTGEFIKPLFDDDVLHPFCVQKLVEVMQQDPSQRLAFSASAIIDRHNNVKLPRNPFASTGAINGVELYKFIMMHFKNVIGELTSIMYRRSAINQTPESAIFCLGAKDYSYGLADVVAYRHLMLGGSVGYVQRELSYFRLDNSLISNSNPSVNKNYVNCVTDWFDIILEDHRMGLLSDHELVSCAPMVDKFVADFRLEFPVVVEFGRRYSAYCAALASLAIVN